jgi:hypothetical protein
MRACFENRARIVRDMANLANSPLAAQLFCRDFSTNSQPSVTAMSSASPLNAFWRHGNVETAGRGGVTVA